MQGLTGQIGGFYGSPVGDFVEDTPSYSRGQIARPAETILLSDHLVFDYGFGDIRRNEFVFPHPRHLREPDVKTVLKRNESYWGRGQVPLEITEIVYTPIKADATRVAALLSGEVRDRLKEAILGLPESQREVLTLRDVDGLSATEVCNVLGLSETNQRVLLHRARTRVRKALEEHFLRE